MAELIAGFNINLARVEDAQPAPPRGLAGGGGITRPWDFRRGRSAAAIPDGTTPGDRRSLCREIGSHARA